jgi:uroporphyrinogen decarboxylase
MHQKHRFIKALRGEAVDRIPLWFMRQAGRYLPEYRALRAQSKGFLDFCAHPEWVAEATLQPIARFNLDAAIIFADILLIPHELGMDLRFTPGEGPQFAAPIRSLDQVHALYDFSASRFDYLWEGIARTQKTLAGNTPLIGFAGAPWTVACYMVEGGSSKAFREVRMRVHAEPALLHALLDWLTESSIAYLNAQIDAGVDAIMLFDSWASLLNPRDYEAFSLHYIKRILAGLKPGKDGKPVPTILFAKGVDAYLEQLATAGSDALGLDWTASLPRARARLKTVGSTQALQGHLDPAVLFDTPDAVAEAVRTMLDSNRDASGEQQSGYVFNLGHGIDQATPLASVQAMVDAVRQWGV